MLSIYTLRPSGPPCVYFCSLSGNSFEFDTFQRGQSELKSPWWHWLWLCFFSGRMVVVTCYQLLWHNCDKEGKEKIWVKWAHPVNRGGCSRLQLHTFCHCNINNHRILIQRTACTIIMVWYFVYHNSIHFNSTRLLLLNGAFKYSTHLIQHCESIEQLHSRVSWRI